MTDLFVPYAAGTNRTLEGVCSVPLCRDGQRNALIVREHIDRGDSGTNPPIVSRGKVGLQLTFDQLQILRAYYLYQQENRKIADVICSRLSFWRSLLSDTSSVFSGMLEQYRFGAKPKLFVDKQVLSLDHSILCLKVRNAIHVGGVW